MKRGLVTYILLLAYCVTSWGQGHSSSLPKVTFGAEWGYMASFLSGYHYNFFDPDGFRVDKNDISAGYYNNGEVTFHVGYNIDHRWNLSLHAGYSGAGGFEPTIPISLRMTRYWGESHLADRWFTLFDLGSGICLKESPQETVSCKLGGGYRISLSRVTKLDFLAAFKALYTHPDIKYYGESIEGRWINRNDGYVGSLFVGISLTF